jgi:hypothetical protein
LNDIFRGRGSGFFTFLINGKLDSNLFYSVLGMETPHALTINRLRSVHHHLLKVPGQSAFLHGLDAVDAILTNFRHHILELEGPTNKVVGVQDQI